MDLQLFVAINIMTISALLIGFIAIYRTGGTNGWLGVNAAVVLVGAVALWLAPESAGTLTAVLFLPLVMAPALLNWFAQKTAQVGRMTEAARYAYWARLLHPSASNRMNARLMAALVRCTETDQQPLVDLAATAPPEFKPIIQSQLALARRDWNEILALSNTDAAADVALKPLQLRALGETGRIEEMAHCFAGMGETFASTDTGNARLIVLALGGRPHGVAALLDTSLDRMDRETKAYWLGTACLNSPKDSEAGRQMLADVAASATNPKTRAAAQRRLDAFASSPPQRLSTLALAELDHVEQRVFRMANMRAQSFWAYPLTVALVIVNLLAFGAEIWSGGSEDAETLVSLGALWPPLVLMGGEWWRLVTASFLHFGALHLATNMFVLWTLGRALEPLIGTICMAFIYAFGGVASSAFVLWLMWNGTTNYGLLVGASGAIFALLGAETAVILREWLRDRENFDRRKLSMLGLMLVLQVGIDVSVPNISFAAHASGFFSGLAAMLVWPYLFGSRRNSRNSSGKSS